LNEDKSELLKSLSIDRSRDDEDTGRASPVLLIAIVAGGVLVGAGAGWFLKPAPKARPVAAEAVQTAATPGKVVAPAGGLTASGYVVARTRATVAAEVTGRVVEVRVEEGQAVRAGQVLAVLDGSLAAVDAASNRARALSAQAAVNSAQLQYAQAQRDLVRAETLAKTGFVSEASVQEAALRARVAEAQADLSRAQLVAARSESNRTQVQLSRYEIRAPFSGIVIDKAAQPGEIISPLSAGGGFTRTGICTIVDMDSLEIEVDVNEAYIGRVTNGQKVEAILDAFPDTVLPARVIAKIPTASRDKATVRVRIGFDSKDVRVLPEMAVKVTFLEPRT
jgi:RND family efflux transporter MFP subunit